MLFAQFFSRVYTASIASLCEVHKAAAMPVNLPTRFPLTRTSSVFRLTSALRHVFGGFEDAFIRMQ